MDAATVVANHISHTLAHSGIPPGKMTVNDVCCLMYDEFDEFLNFSGPKAMQVSEEILAAWLSERNVS